MAKVLLISDSHLDQETFLGIINKHSSLDYYIHCGDSSLDQKDPSLNGFIVVEGNHDEENMFDQKRFVKIENHRCLILHGHLHNIYNGYDKIIEEANKMKCDIVFHGHTHIPYYTKIDNITIINPGSSMFNRGVYGYGTYCIVDISEDINVRYYHHTSHIDVTEYVLEQGIITFEQIKHIIKR